MLSLCLLEPVAAMAAPSKVPSPRPVCHQIKTCHDEPCRPLRICENDGLIKEKVNGVLTAIAPSEQSLLQQRIQKEQHLDASPYTLLFDRPTYVLPLYYTASPYDAVYAGQTPNGQAVKPEEFKAQMSFKWSVWRHMFGTRNTLGLSYTQLFYWQLYARSAYFRETNYAPAVFISNNFHRNWLGTVGFVHQSNGRGGNLERSWNRLYGDLAFSGDTWYVSIKPWVSVVRASTQRYNPDVTQYLGHGRLLFAYQSRRGQQFALMLRNVVESGFKRGAYQLSYSIPISDRSIRFYLQLFSGYGQSLIEYNHHTNGLGIGFAFSDWIIGHDKEPSSGLPYQHKHRELF